MLDMFKFARQTFTDRPKRGERSLLLQPPCVKPFACSQIKQFNRHHLFTKCKRGVRSQHVRSVLCSPRVNPVDYDHDSRAVSPAPKNHHDRSRCHWRGSWRKYTELSRVGHGKCTSEECGTIKTSSAW